MRAEKYATVVAQAESHFSKQRHRPSLFPCARALP